jgi:hypothetical protein
MTCILQMNLPYQPPLGTSIDSDHRNRREKGTIGSLWVRFIPNEIGRNRFKIQGRRKEKYKRKRKLSSIFFLRNTRTSISTRYLIHIYGVISLVVVLFNIHYEMTMSPYQLNPTRNEQRNRIDEQLMYLCSRRLFWLFLLRTMAHSFQR